MRLAFLSATNPIFTVLTSLSLFLLLLLLLPILLLLPLILILILTLILILILILLRSRESKLPERRTSQYLNTAILTPKAFANQFLRPAAVSESMPCAWIGLFMSILSFGTAAVLGIHFMSASMTS